MKYYAVLNFQNRVLGYLDGKDMLKRFKRERNMERYTVQEINQELADKMTKDGYDVSLYYGVILFESELEYFTESFDQLIIDIDCTLKNTVKDILPMLKLTDDEYNIIREFLRLIHDHTDNYIAELFESDGIENEDENRYFKVMEMLKYIIDELN